MIQINNKSFDVFIQESEITSKILEISATINSEYKDKELIFIAILNGAFMFASDMMKNITIPCEISFVKVSSYEGMSSSGRVDELIGLTTSIENKHVIILEDIVDTGITIDKIRTLLSIEHPASLKVCTLLFKPTAFNGKHLPELVGFSIPNNFVVGYGLDYDEKGRNLKEIYQIIDTNN